MRAWYTEAGPAVRTVWLRRASRAQTNGARSVDLAPSDVAPNRPEPARSYLLVSVFVFTLPTTFIVRRTS